MICKAVVKMDRQGRVGIPLLWRREYGLKGGELLNITAARIELVNVDRLEELEKEAIELVNLDIESDDLDKDACPGADTPESGTTHTKTRSERAKTQRGVFV